MKRYLILIFILLFIFPLHNCALKRRAVQPYEGKIRTLSAIGRLWIYGNDWSRSYDTAIVIVPPDKLRINFLGPSGEVIFDLGSKGKRRWGWNKIKRWGMDIEPAQLIMLLLGEGVEGYDVKTADFKLVKGVNVPHSILIEPLSKSTDNIVVEYDQVDINEIVQDEAFSRPRRN